MTIRHTALFSALALAGGFLGGLASGVRTIPAEAKQIPQIRSDNLILVPNNGLRFVTEEGRTIAVLGVQGNNGALALLDSNGMPSVMLAAGPGGTVNIRSVQGGGLLEITSADGRSKARMSAQSAEAIIETNVQGSLLVLRSRAAGSKLMLPGARNARGIELATGTQGSSISIFGTTGRAALTAKTGPTGGLLTLHDAQGETSATVSGVGTFVSVKDGRTVWQAPPKRED
ncbi:MAG: hypothetical protein IIC73_08165 [Armatimonadetes bacterium]|nr:hypothetical protein [Armatimonadota bacterium]